MPAIELVKYEGIGNDFLVHVVARPEDRGTRLTAAFVAALCHRHVGVGADGLIELELLEPGRLRMMLRNADGTDAETSGNGLRCAVFAAYDAGLVDRDVVVETGAGSSSATLSMLPDSRIAEVRVEMGACTVSPLAQLVEDRRAFSVAIGNPHLVLLGPLIPLEEMAVVGPPLERALAGGQNVESAALAGPGRLDLTVFERGVGLTLACGTGSCAAAAAARLIGLVGDAVVVANPGGELLVELAGPDDNPHVALTGPARRVASVSVDPADFVGVAGAGVPGGDR